MRNGQKIPLIDVDTTPITGVVGRETQLPEATVTLGGGTPESVYKVTVDGPEGSAVKNKDVTEELKFIPDVKGEYTITYQGVESFRDGRREESEFGKSLMYGV